MSFLQISMTVYLTPVLIMVLAVIVLMATSAIVKVDGLENVVEQVRHDQRSLKGHTDKNRSKL